MSTLARVSLSIEPIPTLNPETENRPPTIFEKVSKVSVIESDPVGHLVVLVGADDKVFIHFYLKHRKSYFNNIEECL